MGTTRWIQPEHHLQAARGNDPPPPTKTPPPVDGTAGSCTMGDRASQKGSNVDNVSALSQSSPTQLYPACRAVAAELSGLTVVDDDGSKPHASSCTSSDRPQSDGVHRLRMADSQGRARCKTSAAPRRLQWFRRQIVTSSESPVDYEPLVDLFSPLLTLLTLRIQCRLCRRPCYRKPTCTEFRQPPPLLTVGRGG